MVIKIESSDIFTSEQLTKHMKIYAGPGAGKTHFLIENIKNIVKTNDRISKSKARKVLCITYTNSAVDEIKQRLDNYSDAIEVSTIHGFIIKNIITPFQDGLKKIINNEFSIEINTKTRISSQIEGLGILHGCDKETIYEYINKENKSLKTTLDYSKKSMSAVQVNITKFLQDGTHELTKPNKIDDNDVIPIKKYIWSEVGKLTHDEILYFGYKILKEYSIATYSLRVKFPFIFVDEFQDTNPLQVLLLKHIGEKSTIVGVIGDIAQSIYGFQGAKPSQFRDFNAIGENVAEEYSISGNRRSTENIVSLCNFLRSSDSLYQNSIKPYENDEQKTSIESSKISLIIGQSPASLAAITKVINAKNSVILTRSWAAAFDYISDIDSTQKIALRSIYNSYFNSSIDIRTEITEYNNITWVRAFRFILNLQNAYENGSFINVLDALSLYFKVEELKKSNAFSTSTLFQLKRLLKDLFLDISKNTILTEKIIKLNELVKTAQYNKLSAAIFGEKFELQWYTDYDDQSRIESLNKLEFATVQKLYTEVFSKNGKYITVHQAKGLEWDKVLVSIAPSRFDKITLNDMFACPMISEETPEDEFTRIYYVACSRAKEELYICLPSDINLSILTTKLNNFRSQHNCKLEYEIIQ